MLHKKTPLAWSLELGWQALFYSLPGIFDLGQIAVDIGDNYFDGDYKRTILWTIILALNIGWFLPNIVYGIFYYCHIPFIEQYRIQNWVWDQPQSRRRTQYMEVVKSTIITFLVNQVILSWVIISIGSWAMSHTDDQQHVKEFLLAAPGIAESFIRIVLGLLMFETTFYWTHVWLHSPTGYKYHKDHHAFYTPMSLAGQWGSTIDGLVSLPLPSFVPVFIVSLHPTTIWLYCLIQTFHSSYDHCGYDFPFNPFQLIPFGSHAQAHNFHHSHSVDNYGLYWRFWDDLMGTNKAWEAYCAKRDAIIEKINTNQPIDDDDYEVRNGIMVLKCVAEQQHIADGTDNLSHTFQYTHKHVDEHGNLINPPPKAD